MLLYRAEEYRPRVPGGEQALKRAQGNREKASGLVSLNTPAFRKARRERFSDLAGESAEELQSQVMRLDVRVAVSGHAP